MSEHFTTFCILHFHDCQMKMMFGSSLSPFVCRVLIAYWYTSTWERVWVAQWAR